MFPYDNKIRSQKVSETNLFAGIAVSLLISIPKWPDGYPKDLMIHVKAIWADGRFNLLVELVSINRGDF